MHAVHSTFSSSRNHLLANPSNQPSTPPPFSSLLVFFLPFPSTLLPCQDPILTPRALLSILLQPRDCQRLAGLIVGQARRRNLDLIETDFVNGVRHAQDGDVGERVHVLVGTAGGGVESILCHDELVVGR